MSVQDLWADVGRNGDLHAQLNRAIRRRCIGGNECLDALHQAYILKSKLARERLPGADEAEQAWRLLRAIANGMQDAMARVYRIDDDSPRSQPDANRTAVEGGGGGGR